jgi:tetratricopeptide (TPR) repeat protein
MIGGYINYFKEKYHQRRGIRLINYYNFLGALLQFEKAILINPSDVNFFYYAICLIALNNHEKAINYLEKIVKEQTDNLLINTTLCECYFVIRNWDKATEILIKLNEKASENTTIKHFSEIINDDVKRENYAKAKEFFYNAQQQFTKKNMEKAIQDIKLAIEFDPTNSSYHYFAGIILLKSNADKTEIEEYLEKAIMLSPKNENYKSQLNLVKTRYKNKKSK